jgi:flagellar protein FlgJ
MSTAPVNPGYYADFRGLDSLKKSAREHDPQALRKVARQFESLLTGMLLKSVRAAKLGDGFGDSQETGFYQDMLDQQVAVQLSQGRGLGLADMLVQQLTRSGLAGAGEPGAPRRPLAMPIAAPGLAPASRTASTPPALGGLPTLASTAAPALAPDFAPALVPAPLLAPEVAPAAGPSTAAVPVGEQSAFIRRIEPYATRAAARLGVDPEALIAHAALETGWVRHVPAAADGGSSFNLFGIKATAGWSGSSVSARTLEYAGGVPSTLEQPFRSYASLQQALDDYVHVLQGSPRFRAALGTGHDMNAFATGLARGGYATDPAYATKLAAVAEQVRALRAGAEPLKLSALVPTTSVADTVEPRGAT